MCEFFIFKEMKWGGKYEKVWKKNFVDLPAPLTFFQKWGTITPRKTQKADFSSEETIFPRKLLSLSTSKLS